jgi:hypothetical protein
MTAPQPAPQLTFADEGWSSSRDFDSVRRDFDSFQHKLLYLQHLPIDPRFRFDSTQDSGTAGRSEAARSAGMQAVWIYAQIGLACVLLAMTFAVTMRYIVRRSERTSELAKMGFGLGAFFQAKLPKVSEGANMRTTEGFAATTNKGKLDSIKQTRTISREL